MAYYPEHYLKYSHSIYKDFPPVKGDNDALCAAWVDQVWSIQKQAARTPTHKHIQRLVPTSSLWDSMWEGMNPES